MNIFQSIHEYVILILNIYKEYAYISLSNEKSIRVKKNFLKTFFEEKKDIRYLWIIRKYFPSDKYYSYSYSQVLEFTNYSYSYA